MAYVAKAYALACCVSNVYTHAYAPAGCMLPVQSLPTLAGVWARVYPHACTQVNCARPLLAKVYAHACPHVKCLLAWPGLKTP